MTAASHKLAPAMSSVSIHDSTMYRNMGPCPLSRPFTTLLHCCVPSYRAIVNNETQSPLFLHIFTFKTPSSPTLKCFFHQLLKCFLQASCSLTADFHLSLPYSHVFTTSTQKTSFPQNVFPFRLRTSAAICSDKRPDVETYKLQLFVPQQCKCSPPSCSPIHSHSELPRPTLQTSPDDIFHPTFDLIHICFNKYHHTITVHTHRRFLTHDSIVRTCLPTSYNSRPHFRVPSPSSASPAKLSITFHRLPSSTT